MLLGVKRIDYKDFKINGHASLILTYKSYYNIVPSYLCELINKKRKSCEYLLIIPLSNKDCCNTFVERSFIYAAPCV